MSLKVLAFLTSALFLFTPTVCQDDENHENGTYPHYPCLPPAINFRNDSCYVFIKNEEYVSWVKDVWKNPPFRGTTNNGAEDLITAVWDPELARTVCTWSTKNLHWASALSKETINWRLPRIETEAEDDWLNEQIQKRIYDIGTHVWIDLIKEHGAELEIWGSNRAPTTWFNLPNGVDPMWGASDVKTKPRTRSKDGLCYEYHTNHRTDRQPWLEMDVRGFHPRDCKDAYTTKVLMNQQEDVQWTSKNVFLMIAQNFGRTAGAGQPCLDRTGCVTWWNWFKNQHIDTAFRKIYAPVGIACEADLEDFPGGYEIRNAPKDVPTVKPRKPIPRKPPPAPRKPEQYDYYDDYYYYGGVGKAMGNFYLTVLVAVMTAVFAPYF